MNGRFSVGLRITCSPEMVRVADDLRPIVKKLTIVPNSSATLTIAEVTYPLTRSPRERPAAQILDSVVKTTTAAT